MAIKLYVRGIGPLFSILIAKRFPEAQVIAVDKNPVAIKILRENARLNKIKNIEKKVIQRKKLKEFRMQTT